MVTRVLVLVLALATAGCGLGTEERGAQPPPVVDEAPKELDPTTAFKQEVNRVCLTELAKIDGRSFTNVEVYAEWGAIYRAALDVIAFTMGSLGAPPGDEETVSSLVQGLGELSAFIASVSSPEGPTMDADTASFRFWGLQQNLDSYGLVACDLP